MPAVYARIHRSIIRLAPSAGRGVLLIAASIALIGILSPVAAAPDEVTGTDDVSWSVQRPQGQTVRDIHFIDSKRGWFVAGQSDRDCVIMRTDDGGDTWNNLDCPVSQRPDTVFFVDEMTGWVVGGGGLILRTDNGGNGWGRQGSGTSSSLTGVHALDKNHAWISTRGGEILRTTDGGADWDREGTGLEGGLFDIHFFDHNHGWASGSAGLIIRTQNGGRDWYKQRSGTDGVMTAIDFADIDVGWSVGNHIRFTNNGGGTWRRQVEVGKSLEGVAVVDREFVWAVGDEGTMMLTRDGGATWTNEGNPRDWERRGVTSVSAPDRGHMWAAATGGFIIRRIDTGAAPPPATELPRLPTVTPTATDTLTPATPPTPTDTATPTPDSPLVGHCICRVIYQPWKVTRAERAEILANVAADPNIYFGWNELLDPGKPGSPPYPTPGYDRPPNSRRVCLDLWNRNIRYHPLFNRPIWRVGCVIGPAYMPPPLP